MPTRDPVARSGLLRVCDLHGRHVKHDSKKGFYCSFPEPTSTPSASATAKPKVDGSGTNLGVVVGIPMGLIGLFLLLGLCVYFAPRLKRKIRREGEIRLEESD